MKKSLFIALALLLMANLSNAQTIYRCNNDPSVTLSPNMFRTIQAAHDAATAGDIIYVEPSFDGGINGQPITYGDLNCTKTLKIIGNGANSTNTSIIQPFNKKKSLIGYTTIKPTATGAYLQGISFAGQGAVTIYIEAQNVTVESCISVFANVKRTLAGANGNGAKFIKNYYLDLIFEGYNTYDSPTCTYTALQVENIIVKNNYEVTFRNTSVNNYLRRGGSCIVSNSSANVPHVRNITVSNNTKHWGSLGLSVYGENLIVHSNICSGIALISDPYVGISNINASNNICTSTCNYGNNNVENTLYTLIYSDPNSNTEQGFQLSATSPAKNAGLGGIDAGMFGGSDPYRLSCLAPIPQITSYSKNASSGVYTTTTPMTVTLNVRGNN
jgi:hypothetical protein